ncbi:YdeI/OmpD-associated family protein [Taibaiella chishuiensis]|uniref:Uncharacterized protein YdeI (YjbR/CyaY-like superfamily) n=1 Tax=Taibaiella chishuiensis TaxID=1434707 RepID=A0A2P8CXU3_9BACT|nr:YdeI/OmpD-associated family protein [Taibaiella chishuiensis]PSK89783.1 uncharacterized protein YdeI (YjbR/CyaY-like superfamily) [Taibaiella chishuiensis]
MTPTFFKNPAAFRRWLQQHHQNATELVVGFYKTGSGKASITWSEAVDQALCFGWIDGVRTSIDVLSYKIRFTPRKPNSIWSTVNIRKIAALTKAGLMQPAGLEAFNNRNDQKTKLYTHEQDEIKLAPELEQQLKADKAAWTYFQALAPGYRKSSVNWIMGAKQEATRLKRLQQLISDSANGINAFKDNKYKK